ncbi:TonB-dependent receptor [Spirosoma sp. SC4-14]|uniref:SusC/RagA family TonB-linked outer membrane protein n=1 Tax=Spirosoma sp. SC4-14 TaxID=3128900 RepID=UPI0030D1FF0D
MKKAVQNMLFWGLLMLSISSSLYAQTVTVKGKVTSAEEGITLPGVSVIVKGTTTGTTTDNDGNYSINASQNATLVFSFVGMTSKEVKVGNRSVLNVALDPDAKTLDEVVFVAYGSQDKKTITGSQASLDSKNFTNNPLPSADQMLQGKVAGLQSTAFSGQPGANQQVRIRGIGSINASADPLYVIDGVPVNSGDVSRLTTSANTLAGLNPNDIENVTVLKDAASTSIYGSRAANGVILITTKKGKSGKTQVRMDAEYGVNSLAISDQAKPLNRQQYLDLTREGLVNAGYSDAQITTTLNSLGADNTYDTDWLGLVTRQGKTNQYNLSVSGGNEKTTVFASAGYYKQEATVIASDMERISGKINLKHNFLDKLSLGINTTISNTSQKGPSNGSTYANPVWGAYGLRPTMTPYAADGTLNTSRTDYPNIYNPIVIATYDKRTLNTLKGLGSVSLNYNPIPDLNISTRYGIDYNGLEENRYNNPFMGDGRNSNGQGFSYYTRLFNWVWTNQADYRLHLSADREFYADVKVGYEAQKSSTYQISASGTNYPANLDLILPVVAATPTTAQATGSDYTFSSLYSNVNISYHDKYVLSGSFRRDGSSRFGFNNRYGNFYSIGAAWNIDQEEFLRNNEKISSLKLRASYGVNGNGNLLTSSGGPGNYLWRSTYGYGYNYNQNPGSAPNNVGNPDLTWELNKPFDVGVEIGLFNDRLNINADYYVRKTSDLILEVPLSRTSGFSTYFDNVGAMKNSGLELTVSGSPIRKALRWDVSFNIAFNKNTITALDNNQDIISGSFIRRVGENFQTFYLREWAGVDPQTGSPLWYKNTTNADGTIDHSTTTSYNQAQQVLAGSASPKAFGGFSNTLSWKGLTLDAQLVYTYGNYIRDTWAQYYMGDGYNPSRNKIVQQLDHWRQPGDVSENPKFVYNNSNQSYSSSTRFLYKGDYIRLRNITLSYALPAALVRKAKLSNVNVYLRGTNLWTLKFDKKLYFDPEQGISGETNNNVFISKVVSAGLNLTF